jgi:signal transduction histidine kinase
VVKLNEAAIDSFGLDRDAATTADLASCLGADLETVRTAETVELEVPEGTRHFETTVSGVSDRFGRQPGHAIAFTDVTQERVRSQRLSVLNRVLRHNLRNGMTAIMGQAERIANDDHEYSDSAESILTSADDLMATSRRARQIEQMMAAAPDAERTRSLVDVAERVVDEYRTAHPDASLSVDIDPALTVPVDDRVLSVVLDNLVENAVVHNDAPTPVVTVGARVVDGGIRVSVSDNGPGIPAHEREVIEAGEEDALEHGSGLGLWAVKWGVVRLGGELRFSENHPHGTVVMIGLPSGAEPGSPVPTVGSAETEAEAD